MEYSTFHNAVGVWLLCFTYAMSELVWGPGITLLVLSWMITLYTLWQMFEMVRGRQFEHKLVLEIQTTILPSPEKPSKEAMLKFVRVAYFPVAICYFQDALIIFYIFPNIFVVGGYQKFQSGTRNTSTVDSASTQNYERRPRLAAPKSQARPVKIKTSKELKGEEIEKALKLKTRPSNKMSITSKPCHDKQNSKITTPKPFNLCTEERGAEKKKKFVTKIMLKSIEEKQAMIRKATQCPLSTYYPVVPPKPEPKSCTKSKPFNLRTEERGAQKKFVMENARRGMRQKV